MFCAVVKLSVLWQDPIELAYQLATWLITLLTGFTVWWKLCTTSHYIMKSEESLYQNMAYHFCQLAVKVLQITRRCSNTNALVPSVSCVRRCRTWRVSSSGEDPSLKPSSSLTVIPITGNNPDPVRTGLRYQNQGCTKSRSVDPEYGTSCEFLAPRILRWLCPWKICASLFKPVFRNLTEGRCDWVPCYCELK